MDAREWRALVEHGGDGGFVGLEWHLIGRVGVRPRGWLVKLSSLVAVLGLRRGERHEGVDVGSELLDSAGAVEVVKLD